MKLWKKLVLLASTFVFLIGCGDDTIELVKSGTFNEYPTKNIGALLESNFTTTSWELKKTNQGETIVEFQGTPKSEYIDFLFGLMAPEFKQNEDFKKRYPKCLTKSEEEAYLVKCKETKKAFNNTSGFAMLSNSLNKANAYNKVSPQEKEALRKESLKCDQYQFQQIGCKSMKEFEEKTKGLESKFTKGVPLSVQFKIYQDNSGQFELGRVGASQWGEQPISHEHFFAWIFEQQ